MTATATATATYAYYSYPPVYHLSLRRVERRFTTNYSLSFKYLDKIFGTYHEGRKPGPTPVCVGETPDP